MNKRVGIVGWGRFGQLLAKILLAAEYQVVVTSRTQPAQLPAMVSWCDDLAEFYQQVKTVWLAVPISAFELVVKQHRQYWQDHLVLDVLSVKLHPKRVMETYVSKNQARVILTHPMFGPDSYAQTQTGLPWMITNLSAEDEEYSYWKNEIQKWGFQLIEISARQHDQWAASSQGLTHFVGRLLELSHYAPTPIDTQGARLLHQVKQQTVNDTWQLFYDLQRFNPYTKQMRLQLGESYERLYNLLLPETQSKDELVFGIQGGRGSFNEEAVLDYAQKRKLPPLQIKYLFTTARVLEALHQGEVDRGIFAIQNSVGGLVTESIEAMAEYKFEIVEEYPYAISHHLMVLPDMTLDKIDQIMAHPQVFKQCRSTLARKYPKVKLTSGEGELIDTAKAAAALVSGELPSTTAILGPRQLSKLYRLKIVDQNLQDDKQNLTSFLIVKRPFHQIYY